MWIWKWIKKWFTPKEQPKPKIDLTGLTKGDIKKLKKQGRL